MSTIQAYPQFTKSPKTTQNTMQTQPMNRQDVLTRLLEQEEASAKNRAILLQMMQQQAATPAAPAAPAPAPVVVAAKPVAKATTPAKPAAPVVQLKKGNPHYTPEQKKKYEKELIEMAKKAESEDKFVEEACKIPKFTQQIIAGARGIKDVSSRENGFRLLYRKGGRTRRTFPKKPKKAPKKKNPDEWENKGDYYAIDDDMIKERCQKAAVEGIGERKKAFQMAEMKYVFELVKMVKASTTRADASKAELGAAAAKFIKDPANEKFEGRYLQLLLNVPNLSNREYGYKNLLRLYAPGCPPLQDRGISKKNKNKPTSSPKKRPAPAPAPAAPVVVIAAPTQAIAQPAPKKQKVDDAVGSPTTVKDVKDITPYRRQLLIKALQHCQLPEAQYSAVKWYARYGTMLGCTKAKFHRHIDVRLKAQGFKWENWGQGKGKWCLDHMKPIRNFLQTLPDEVERCWHYTNIMPEDWEYNTWKSDKDIWRMYWSLDRWLIHGRNESFRGEEQEHFDRGMPRGAWRSQDGIKDREEQDKNKIVFN